MFVSSTFFKMFHLTTATLLSCKPQSIDNVQFLHLGFNKLRLVPKFGSRAKYNLRTLNLRNNELVTIDGG